MGNSANSITAKIQLAFRVFTSTVLHVIKYGPPKYVLYFGQSLGDNLLLTVLAAEIQKREKVRIWIKSDHAQLFENNPHVSRIFPLDTFMSRHVIELFGGKVIRTDYTTYNPVTDQDAIPEKHITLKMADNVPIKGSVDIKPCIFLTDAEKQKGIYGKKQIVIITSNTTARMPMLNKEWFGQRYQEIVNRFKNDYTIIQLGAVGDYTLQDVIDLRGKTNIRESAAILNQSALMISYVGFMMHLARAVDCPSVIIYGGREKPEQSGYTGFTNIYSPVECSPCWFHSRCNYSRKCMDMITAQQVVDSIETTLKKSRGVLPADILIN